MALTWSKKSGPSLDMGPRFWLRVENFWALAGLEAQKYLRTAQIRLSPVWCGVVVWCGGVVVQTDIKVSSGPALAGTLGSAWALTIFQFYKMYTILFCSGLFNLSLYTSYRVHIPILEYEYIGCSKLLILEIMGMTNVGWVHFTK